MRGLLLLLLMVRRLRRTAFFASIVRHLCILCSVPFLDWLASAAASIW
jgi:hypothetical protein